MTPFCLVGQALIDVTLPQYGQPYKMRLGGILHAARAMWAIGRPYALAYAAPDYMHSQVEEYAKSHGAIEARPFASVTGSPNVVLIHEVKEAGDQGYEFLLRDEHRCTMKTSEICRLLEENAPSDMLIISGGFDLGSVLAAGKQAGVRNHVDIHGNYDDWAALKASGCLLDTLALSTSSALFHDYFSASPLRYWDEAMQGVSLAALLKENRGGCRLRLHGYPDVVSAPAFLGDTAHSVGIGDCFDSVWLSLRISRPDREALTYASLVAADYAATTYPDEFRATASTSLSLPSDEVMEAVGTRVAWEDRPQIHVYIAAPDFDFADRRPIEMIANALRYHNFVPRLPIRENGQMGENASPSRKAGLLAADLAMLDQCCLMVAVLTYDDPGTLIEIGMACERGMPVAVFDPYRRAENLMLTGVPNLVSDDPERIISWVYQKAGR